MMLKIVSIRKIATETALLSVCSVCYNWGQCVSNARLATSLALQFGSPGILITDWSEHHYTAPVAIVLSAVAIGAGFAWTGPTQQALSFYEETQAQTNRHTETDRQRDRQT